jgi:hypothetical protein
MDTGNDTSIGAMKLKNVWNQTMIPVVLRRGGNGERLRVRLPKKPDNFEWLRNGRSIRPQWFAGEQRWYWELPKKWFNDFVNRALERYGKVYVIQPFREQEVCARACMEANGHECQCSCMGANHGAGVDGSWFEVSDTFAVRGRKPELACRLMIKK